jgi:hypothetical protein
VLSGFWVWGFSAEVGGGVPRVVLAFLSCVAGSIIEAFLFGWGSGDKPELPRTIC